MKLNKLFTQGLKTVEQIGEQNMDYIKQIGEHQGEWERNAIKSTLIGAVHSLDTIMRFLYSMSDDTASAKRQYQFIYNKYKDIRAVYMQMLDKYN